VDARSLSRNGRKPPPIDRARLRQLAVTASADPRTVLRVLRGEPVRGLAYYRIRDVLLAEGLLADDGVAR